MKSFDFKTYISPLTWRYGSAEMRRIFSEENKYLLWRKIWVALAAAQNKSGLVNEKELADLKKNEKNIDIQRILEIEKDTKHDVVAAITEFAQKAKIGAGKIHLGATSMDIVDNADMIRIHEAINIIEIKLKTILKLLAEKIEKYADLPCLGYTHLQPAEPTTVGYRLSLYAQDLHTDLALLELVKKTVKGKGMKGAVGTGASYEPGIDEKVMQQLGIEAVTVSSQVYPRKFDFLVLTLLASISSSLAKFAGDLRLLQTPGVGEWSEPFGKKQVGSSAMPFKKNPLDSEKICSLARFVGQLPAVGLENATLSYLERTLDDSANKRIIVPEGFLAVDEILTTAEKILSGLFINEERIKFNLSQYGPFAATEGIIIETVKSGANRQEMHELLRTISLEAWSQIQKGEKNPMEKLLIGEKNLLKYISREKIMKLLKIENHIGDAPERARKLALKIKTTP